MKIVYLLSVTWGKMTNVCDKYIQGEKVNYC